MNPNSGNQRWGRWTFTIWPGPTKRPSFADIKANAARFARKGFGSATQMHVALYATPQGKQFVQIMIRSEGHPIHDPTYVEWMRAQWQRWAENGWGPGTEVKLTEAKFEAGSKQDGTPPEQLVIAPAISLGEESGNGNLRWLRRRGAAASNGRRHAGD